MSQGRILFTTAGSSLVLFGSKSITPTSSRSEADERGSRDLTELDLQSYRHECFASSGAAPEAHRRRIHDTLFTRDPDARASNRGGDCARVASHRLGQQIRGRRSCSINLRRKYDRRKNCAVTDDRPTECPSPTESTAQASEKDPRTSVEDWEKEMDLLYIEDDKLRARVLVILRKHSRLWSGALETIRATGHRLPLEAETKLIRSMPYRKGPAMREIVAKEVNNILNSGFIEPTSTEWRPLWCSSRRKTVRFGFAWNTGVSASRRQRIRIHCLAWTTESTR